MHYDGGFLESQKSLLSDTEIKDGFYAVGWYDKDTKIIFRKGLDGIQLLIGNDKNRSSIILHFGSYGAMEGLFEVMPKKRVKAWGDSVKGHLYLKDAIKYAIR